MQCLDQDGKIACKSGRVRIAGYLAMNKTCCSWHTAAQATHYTPGRTQTYQTGAEKVSIRKQEIIYETKECQGAQQKGKTNHGRSG
jgi:hypothetical protein